MADNICEICHKEKSKYKCPKCQIKYCSLVCFKSELHTHENLIVKDSSEELSKNISITSVQPVSQPLVTEQPKFQRMLKNPQLQDLLKYKSLQFHLTTLIKILEDPNLTKEQTKEGRKEIANKKLCDLRVGGVEENSLIEEFCQLVIELWDEC